MRFTSHKGILEDLGYRFVPLERNAREDLVKLASSTFYLLE